MFEAEVRRGQAVGRLRKLLPNSSSAGEGASDGEIDPDGTCHTRGPEHEIEARLRVPSRSRDVHLLEEHRAAGLALTPVPEHADAGVVATNQPPPSRAASRVHTLRVQGLAAYCSICPPVLAEACARRDVVVGACAERDGELLVGQSVRSLRGWEHPRAGAGSARAAEGGAGGEVGSSGLQD